MIFLGWHQPLLHATVNWLLDAAHIPETPDLSRTLVVVRGNRASRRLLELLAQRCAAQGLILVPPEIITPAQLIPRLTQPLPEEGVAASPLASVLAWAQALENAAPEERDRLFRAPGGEETRPGVRALSGMGRHLQRIREELGGAGLGFRDVIRILDERFPNIAPFEVPRWEVMEALHAEVSRILQSRGLIDETQLLFGRARRGEILTGQRVVLAGVPQLPRLVRDFVVRLPDPPAVLVGAPESEREGFTDSGQLHPAYWNSRRAALDSGQIHLVERDRDQALRAAQIVSSWHDEGVPPAQMTLAAPDAESLPRLREALEARGLRTRWAQGRPASDAPAFQLLSLVVDYLDRTADEPPRYEAVAALARHPDLPRLDPADWKALDAFAGEHLPARFDTASVDDASVQVRKIDDVLRRLIDITPEETAPRVAAEWTLRFLVGIYGGHEENALSPVGRVAVHALELLRDVLADILRDRLPWPGRVRPADFLHVLLNFLGEEPVPEPPDPAAVEIVGWLELADDDAPAVAVASFREDAVPESVAADPFLPGALRQALDLNSDTARMARDAFALAALLACRGPGQGTVALLAPRFDAADNPVRPSRLLLNGLAGEELARRVWHLAGRRNSDPQPTLHTGTGFGAVTPGAHPPPAQISVTAFRDYIESPRKFFFLRVLNLKAADDAVTELDGSDAGTLIHDVLSAFGTDSHRRDETDAAAIAAWLDEKFTELTRARFGRWAQPAVEVQLEEIRRRLLAFAPAQAALRAEGWRIRYVEGSGDLAGELVASGDAGLLELTGRIDRIDSDAEGKRWRIIDYKASAKPNDPWKAHFRQRTWVDLQLPLYLKLAAPYARREWGVELTPDNCELRYFQLPEDTARAGLSEPFPAAMIEDGWTRAAEVAAAILRGEFAEDPPATLDPRWTDPALLALCGQVGLREAGAEIPAEVGE